MPTKYIKEFARNYSFFQIVAYRAFTHRPNPAFDVPINIGHPLFINRGGPLSDVCFPPGEMKNIYAEFGRALGDERYFNRLVSGSAVTLELIQPYFEQHKRVNNLEELRYLYELYLDFLYGESASWVAPHIKELPEALRSQAMSIRERTQHLSSLRDGLFDFNLQNLYPDLGDLVHFLTPQVVFSGKTVPELRAEASKYQDGFTGFDDVFYAGYSEDILTQLDIELEEDSPEPATQEIRGQIASAGKAKGRVKIVWTNRDNQKIEPGDILVSPMTRPDFLPAMKIASAFVTDEGGITCHAAIVSREMHKPCIIGTKIATKLLHDGDEIEVDAEAGVIKILNRA